MFKEWYSTLDINSLLVGLLIGLLLTVVFSWLAWRRGNKQHAEQLAPRLQELETSLDTTLATYHQRGEELARLESERNNLLHNLQDFKDRLKRNESQLEEKRLALSNAEQKLTMMETRLGEKEQHFHEQLEKLEQAEKRLTQSFEHLAGKIFDERSKQLSKSNTQQLDSLLKPLGENLKDFRKTVTDSHKEEIAQHRVLQEKLKELEQLNERLHDDAESLTKALTQNVKTQGNWGEQQLERLLELAGLAKGREFSTQVSVTTESGTRVQPDLVLHLPEGKSIIMDSKVSLNAWTRYQASDNEEQRQLELKDHVQSLKTHIKGLGEKRYAEVEELNALDFVLMFVPIEAALIEALQAEPDLAAYALQYKVALLSPTNLLATLRTVASVWMVHKQNNNAQEIAKRAGLLYDKFVGFVENLQQVGDRLRQAQDSYDKAHAQLSQGSGNLVRQTQLLEDLGARTTKKLDSNLSDAAKSDGVVPLKPVGEDKDAK